MKKLFLTLSLLLFVSPLCAQEQSRNSPIVDVVETMAQTYLRSFSQDLAVKELERMAENALGKSIDGKIGSALSLYSIYENIHAYDKASSDTQRYQATAHAVASAATLINPVVGGLVQGAVLIQDLAAAFIFKSYQLKMANLRAEIVNIQKQISDLHMSQFQAENKAFQTLLARQMAVSIILKAQTESPLFECYRPEKVQQLGLQKCFDFVQFTLKIFRLQKGVTESMLSFEGRFIRFSRLATDEHSKVEVEQIKKNMDTLQAGITQGEVLVAQILRHVSEERVSAIESQHHELKMALQCERKILKIKAQVVILRKTLRETPEESYWAQLELDDLELDLRNLQEILCKP